MRRVSRAWCHILCIDFLQDCQIKLTTNLPPTSDETSAIVQDGVRSVLPWHGFTSLAIFEEARTVWVSLSGALIKARRGMGPIDNAPRMRTASV